MGDLSEGEDIPTPSRVKNPPTTREKQKAETLLVLQPQVEEKIQGVWMRHEGFTNAYFGKFQKRIKKKPRNGRDPFEFGNAPKKQLFGLILDPHKCSAVECIREIYTIFPLCHAHLLKEKHLQIRRTSLVERSGASGVFAFDPTALENAVIFKENDPIIDFKIAYKRSQNVQTVSEENDVLFPLKLHSILSNFGSGTPDLKNASYVLEGDKMKITADKPIKNNTEIIFGDVPAYSILGEVRLYWRVIRVRKTTAERYSEGESGVE